MKQLYFILTIFVACISYGQSNIKGIVTDGYQPVAGATVSLEIPNYITATDGDGAYLLEDVPAGNHTLTISYIGFKTVTKQLSVTPGKELTVITTLKEDDKALEEVVITGTMKEVSRSDSPIPVEIITPKLFRKNPTASLFEAVGMINGVMPQLNCNVCNTGDIHINGMEGPYTMILIDGMPIVSALSTVYGLSGIPNSIVERIEVVKGPASSLYGSEAMGGLINVITKSPSKAPTVSADYFFTSWGELSADAAVKINAGKASSLLGINYFNYNVKADKNNDNFTDVTQQNRISIFNKWSFERKENRLASIAARYVYEDRWGGEMQWTKQFRGSDSIYGESIYTKRAELIGLYQLPFTEKIFTQFSYNWHNQNSWYGTTPYMATQQVGFLQTYWDKQFGENHTFLLGAALRYTRYDDNTPATASADGTENRPQNTPLPGIFVQDEWTLNDKHKLLGGYRFDYDRNHGGVHSPRVAYKFSPDVQNTFRASFGTGFRVVNLFTEDHAALTGARQVVITESLKPERSYNGNLNYVWKFPAKPFILNLDVTAFYSYFTNKIVGDFDTDPTKIIYANLNGHAISQGISVNTDLQFNFPLKLMAGISYIDVFRIENTLGESQRIQQLHAPKWSGNFIATYSLPNNYSVDVTGNWYGPMRLPIQPNDYRPEYSPWYCTANIQFTKKMDYGLEIYCGFKNIFDFVPRYSLMRPFDPFNKDADNPVSNPNGYTFDTAYNYASLQGRRVFLGMRYNLGI
ncbi:TonB-dependent receptor [Flavobacterium psychrotrophum]|uniref:TonB-dependent receptor n=1 Tax=Flavobacterium psychrotrophum TaxID=2294119 RepID=UPI000E31638A|nr:TonB-dependent receptor [Flavobacterium psychrotrophum]